MWGKTELFVLFLHPLLHKLNNPFSVAAAVACFHVDSSRKGRVMWEVRCFSESRRTWEYWLIVSCD